MGARSSLIISALFFALFGCSATDGSVDAGSPDAPFSCPDATSDLTTSDLTTSDATTGDASADLGTPTLDDLSALGSCTVSASSLQFLVAGRLVDVEVHSPQQTLAGDGCSTDIWRPLLFFPENAIEPDAYAESVKYWVSWGYTVYVPRTFAPPTGLAHADALVEAQALIASLIAARPPAINSDFKFAVSGHGYGARLALLLALAEDQISSVILIDPLDSTLAESGVAKLTSHDFASFTAPLLLVAQNTNETCTTPDCTPCTPNGDGYRHFFPLSETPTIQITIKGADHWDWLDYAACGFLCELCEEGYAQNDRVKALSRKYVMAFLRLTFEGEPAYSDLLLGEGFEDSEASQRQNRAAYCGYR